ncbi:MAG TPA: phosphatase PAP2 family protein, partial [Candidatus Paceibacterota bacterium]|nr:phosphatase PAP2 family protein [Candidatus Paceibacterota bacterium]
MSFIPHHVRRRMPKDPWWHVFGLSFGLAFALMLMAARLHPHWLDGVDGWIESAIQPLQTFAHVETFLVITVLGSAIGIPTIALGALYFLRHNRLAQLQLVLLLVFSSVSMGIAKMFVERARPSVLTWLDPSNTYSFPSGHATLSAAFYGFVSVQ